MIVFKCKRSGNTVIMKLPHDIESLRKHEGYEEVKPQETVAEPVVEVVKTEEVVEKKRGRPSRKL